MTTEAFGRLASWSSFNIVVGRHDEFAHSRVAIPQKRGTTAKSIVLHFPHPTHSNWKPRKDAIPATPVTAITRGAVGCHAKIGKTRVASHTHWRKSTPNAPPPPQSTTMTHFPPQSNTSHSRIHHYEASQSNGMQYQAHTTTTGRTNIAFTSVRFEHHGHSRLCANSSRDMATT